MADLIRLQIKGLSKVMGSNELVLVMLIDPATSRQLVVPCDEHMGYQLRMRMDASLHSHTEELLPEVLTDMFLKNVNLSEHYRFVICGINKGKYLGHLEDVQTGERKPIRCSDGILLSLVAPVPIFVDAALLKAHAVHEDGEMVQIPLPVDVVTDDMLQTSLKHAIETEDYEMASSLRDELRKRHDRKDHNDHNDSGDRNGHYGSHDQINPNGPNEGIQF